MDFKYIKVFSEEEAEEYFKKPGFWVAANINQNIGWPKQKTLIEFRDKMLLLLPEDDTLLPAITFRYDKPTNDDDARLMISQYLSSLSWVEEKAINIVGWTGGGPHPFRRAKSASVQMIGLTFHHKYFPDPSDKDTRLALAFYREGLSLNHVAYSFLSYYKIINLKFARGTDQKNWIEENLLNLTDRDAIKRRDELSGSEDSVSDYIYVSCRCAIAHAGTEPTVNPENFEDERRLNQDLPLIKNLAEIMIESEFGVKSSRTIYQEHFYELYGFKNIFDTNLVQSLKEKKKPSISNVEIPFNLSVRLWNKQNYLPFENLSVKETKISEGILSLNCLSADSSVQFIIELDFANEKVKIDPFAGIILVDKNDEQSSRFMAEYYRFLKDYFANGQLEIWNTNEEECLSQCDPFIPVNIDLGATIENFKKLEEFHMTQAESRKGN